MMIGNSGPGGCPQFLPLPPPLPPPMIQQQPLVWPYEQYDPQLQRAYNHFQQARAYEQCYLQLQQQQQQLQQQQEAWDAYAQAQAQAQAAAAAVARPPGSDVELTLVRTAAVSEAKRTEETVIDVTPKADDATVVTRAIAQLPNDFDASVEMLEAYAAADPQRGKEIMEALLVSVTEGTNAPRDRDASLRLTVKLIESTDVIFTMDQLESLAEKCIQPFVIRFIKKEQYEGRDVFLAKHITSSLKKLANAWPDLDMSSHFHRCLNVANRVAESTSSYNFPRRYEPSPSYRPASSHPLSPVDYPYRLRRNTPQVFPPPNLRAPCPTSPTDQPPSPGYRPVTPVPTSVSRLPPSDSGLRTSLRTYVSRRRYSGIH